MQTLQKLQWEHVTPEVAVRYRALPMLAPSADYAAANLYMWNETYGEELAFVGNRATGRILEEDGQYRYLFPIGDGEIDGVLDALNAEARARGEVLRFVGVSEPELLLLQQRWGDALEITETREWADYLYEAEKLATLSGKKLHGKRNHINAFCAAHTYETRLLTPDDMPSCMQILSAWYEAHAEEEGVEEELCAIRRGFAHFDVLALEGMLLFADGAPVAFCVASRVTPDCLCVHFEKAVPGVDGAYPMINREFVRAMLLRYPELRLVNREDDMGLEKLRTAKLSYRPHALLRKFCVRVMV